MRAVCAVPLVVVACAAGAARADLWAKDGRSALITFVEMTGAVTANHHAVVVDLCTKKTEDLGYESSNCQSGDDTKAGERAVADCIRDRAKNEAASTKKIEAWRKAHDAVETKPAPSSPDGAGSVAIVRGDVRQESGETFATATFKVTSKARPDHEGSLDLVGTRIEPSATWSPDGQWVLAEGPGPDDTVVYAFVAGVARVDLLDAGAGASTAALAAKLGAAGYAPSHQGKSSAPHKVTDVYFAPGFQADAERVAAANGASAPQPLTWCTPYAITVAAAAVH